MSSGWFLEAAWCPQSASQGMDLCDQILTSRGSTTSISASLKPFLSAYHMIPRSNNIDGAANNVVFFF